MCPKKRRYDKIARSDRRKLLHSRRLRPAFLFLYKLAFLKSLKSEQLYHSLLIPEESHIMLLCYLGTLITREVVYEGEQTYEQLR